MEKSQNDLVSHYSVYLNTPENRDVIGVIGTEIGRGVQGVVYNIGRSDSVLKLYFDTPENLQVTRSEACRQEDFCDTMWYGYKEGIPKNCVIPELLHKIYNSNHEIIGIVMKKIDGKSLNTIEAGNIAIKNGKLSTEEFQKISEGEFTKRLGDLRPGYKYYPDDFTVNNFDEELIHQIKRMYEFFQKCGLEHGDLHSGNIMLGKSGELYFLDFGKSSILPKKAAIYKHALSEGKIFRLEALLQKDTLPEGIFHGMDDLEKLTYILSDNVRIRDEEFVIHHNGIPRNIASHCMAIAYSKLKAQDPRVDNYFYHNQIGYDIGGGYFLVCEEGRYDGVENEFSKEVLHRVVQPNLLRGYIKDSKNRIYGIYSINQDTSDIITQVTRGHADKIIGNS